MPRKARKSLTLWKECEICACIINTKDIELHLNSCPPNEDNWSHSFIKQQCFTTTCEEVDVKAVPTWMRADMIDDAVFLSQSVMQICGFVVGFPLMMVSSGKVCIKKAWPTVEVCLTNVTLLKEALEVCWDSKLTSNIVTVKKMEMLPQIVNELHFRIKNMEEEDINFDELFLVMHNKFKDRIFFKGNKFLIPFYGKKIFIKIVECKHYISSIMEIKDLTLDKTPFMCDDNTQFVCLNNRRITDVTSHCIKFGGYESILSELKQNITAILEREISTDSHSLGVLVHGIHGTGKTLTVNYLVSLFKINVVNIQGMEMFSKYYGETEEKLRSLFKRAIDNAPSFILLDNIEVLCPKKGSDQERRVASTLLSLFDNIQNKKIVVLATSSKPDNIELSLRRPGRLEIEIEIPVPDVQNRIAILTALLPEMNLSETLKKIAEFSHGFVAADLASVVSKAQSKATLAGRNATSEEDLFWAHSQVMPSAMREVFVQIPNVKWSDIAGQEELKLKLKQCVEWPIKYQECFTRLGIKPPRGVLLYGPPGCSKTMIAQAIATESRLNFISVKGSDIFSKWVGKSERAIRDVFKRARCVAPCIVFIDEIDALGGERESAQKTGGAAVQERVLSQLLTEMDGVVPLENVIVIAATNRPDRIDKALLRPGRLDRIIYVPLPDLYTRRQLFELQFRKMPVESGVNVEFLSEKTNGYSGAEIIAVCNEAAFKAMEEAIDASEIKMGHFSVALQLVTPRTPITLMNLYEDYLNNKKLLL